MYSQELLVSSRDILVNTQERLLANAQEHIVVSRQDMLVSSQDVLVSPQDMLVPTGHCNSGIRPEINFLRAPPCIQGCFRQSTLLAATLNRNATGEPEIEVEWLVFTHKLSVKNLKN